MCCVCVCVCIGLCARRGRGLVYLVGDNFGPVGTVVTVVYSPKEFPALNFTAQCSVSVPHTTVTCLTVPGVGTSMFWLLIVGGQFSVGSFTSYCPPVVTAVAALPALATGNNACPNPVALVGNVSAVVGTGAASPLVVFDADGRSRVRLDGQNFGNNINNVVVEAVQAGTNVSFQLTSSAGCVMTVPHEQVVCPVPAGVGTGFFWRIIVQSLPSSLLLSQATGYGPPTVSSMSPTVGSSAGGHFVNVLGSQLGFQGQKSSQIQVSLAGVPVAQIDVISSCWLRFFLPPGEGAGLPLLLIIGGVPAVTDSGAPVTYSYQPPQVDAATLFSTRGSLSLIWVQGAGFGNGPVNTTGGSFVSDPSAVGALTTVVIVTTNTSVYTCLVDLSEPTIPFTRAGFLFQSPVTDGDLTVVVGGQTSAAYSFTRVSLQVCVCLCVCLGRGKASPLDFAVVKPPLPFPAAPVHQHH